MFEFVERPIEADASLPLYACAQENCAQLLQPIEWDEVEDGQWRIVCYCPQCQLFNKAIFDQTTADKFDRELDNASFEIAQDLRSFAQTNMQDEAKRFSTALHAGGIFPEDF
jgi:hypothetical protein